MCFVRETKLIANPGTAADVTAIFASAKGTLSRIPLVPTGIDRYHWRRWQRRPLACVLPAPPSFRAPSASYKIELHGTTTATTGHLNMPLRPYTTNDPRYAAHDRPRASTGPAQPHLDQLTAARERFDETKTSAITRRPTIVVAAIAGLAAGLVIFLSSPATYYGVATIRAYGFSDPAASGLANASLAPMPLWDWPDSPNVRLQSVTLTRPDTVRIAISSTDRDAISDAAQRAVTTFQGRVKAIAAEIRDTPGPDERVLTTHLDSLRTRLAQAKEKIDVAVAQWPVTDPSQHRQALLSQWQTLRTDLAGTRQVWVSAQSQVDELRYAPAPTHGVVRTDIRRDRLAADRALQQDLSELHVTLTELKLHLLTVWQNAAASLDSVVAKVETFTAIVDTAQTTASKTPDQRDTIVDQTASYHEELSRFEGMWNREFTTLRLVDVDPMSGQVIDIAQRVRRILNDFLYTSGKHLTAVRTSVRDFGRDGRDSARSYVFQSNLVRRFEALQSAHHRFEFAGGAIETPENFRLDAALLSARGLRRRTQARIRGIDQQLETVALEQAKIRRTKDLEIAEQEAIGTRNSTDKTVDELLAMQEELNLSADQSEAFLRATMKAEVANARFERVQADLEDVETRLQRAVADRTTHANAIRVELRSCEVGDRPVNLSARLRTSGIGATLTLVLVLLGQWLFVRRG